MNFVAEEFDFVVGNEELAIMGLKTPFDDLDLSDVTAFDYAQTVHSGMEEQNPTEVTDLMDKKGAYYKLFSTQANRYNGIG